MIAYLVDVGVLLSDNNKDFEAYSNVYDKQYGYFDENQYYVKDIADALKRAKEYVNKGVDLTYAVVSETYIPYNYDFDSGDLGPERYRLEAVVYSAAKINDAVVEGFVGAKKLELEMSFLEKCYELYKQDWFKQRDINVENILENVEDILEEAGIFDECPNCLSDFVKNEYRDRNYMASILSDDDFRNWHHWWDNNITELSGDSAPGSVVRATVYDCFSGYFKVIENQGDKWLLEVVDVSMCYPQQVQSQPGERYWINENELYKEELSLDEQIGAASQRIVDGESTGTEKGIEKETERW